jgi:hypothetical protein
MGKFDRLGTLFGVAAFAVALLGVALLLAAPAAAGDDGSPGGGNICQDDQGLMTPNLGI